MRGAHRANAQELQDPVLDALSNGDVVMVKGSNGSRMMDVVAAIKQKFSPAPVIPS
jgi:UDP-N-acetylmuramoyl-tripeptide--D-alanyl-D-alanine ligase